MIGGYQRCKRMCPLDNGEVLVFWGVLCFGDGERMEGLDVRVGGLHQGLQKLWGWGEEVVNNASVRCHFHFGQMHHLKPLDLP